MFKTYQMKKIIYLLFLSHLPFYAQTLSISVDDTITSFVDRTTPHLLEIVYTSPMEESKFHNNNRNIIIRNDFELTIEEIYDNYEFSIIGELSGSHKFDIALAIDLKTISFKSAVNFFLGETVLFSAYRKGDSLRFYDLSFTIKDRHLNSGDKVIDHFPKTPIVPDYEILINNNPSALNLFFMVGGPPQKPVNIIDPDGILIFSEFWSQKGFDWKVNHNNHLTYYDREANRWLMMDSLYTLVDSISCLNGYIADNHDFIALENGNYILFAYDDQIVDLSSVVSGGSPNAVVEGLVIQELDQEHNLLLEWRSWDHINITDNTYVDLTSNDFDLLHCNAIDIDFDNNLLISSRSLDEITKIDRLTGEIIWRWGGSQNEFEFINDYPFTHQHSIRALGESKYILFDNGNFSAQYTGGVNISRALIYELDTINFIATKLWEFSHPDELFAPSTGGVQMLPNNNILINWGNLGISNLGAVITEVDTTNNNEIVFELRCIEGQNVYRAQKYDWFFDESIVGCMDDSASNYSSDYIIVDNSCVYNEFSCVEKDAPLFLPVGWSLFGYTCMNSIALDVAFEDIIDSIVIVKDYLGSAYLPEWEFNGIGELDFSEGYQIKLTNSIEGFQFCPIQSIDNDLIGDFEDCSLIDVYKDFPEGWSFLGYYCEESQNVTDVLFDITDELIIVKDYLGAAYLPEWNFNGIGMFDYGEAYQIKLDESVTGLYLCPFFSLPE